MSFKSLLLALSLSSMCLLNVTFAAVYDCELLVWNYGSRPTNETHDFNKTYTFTLDSEKVDEYGDTRDTFEFDLTNEGKALKGSFEFYKDEKKVDETGAYLNAQLRVLRTFTTTSAY